MLINKKIMLTALLTIASHAMSPLEEPTDNNQQISEEVVIDALDYIDNLEALSEALHQKGEEKTAQEIDAFIAEIETEYEALIFDEQEMEPTEQQLIEVIND